MKNAINSRHAILYHRKIIKEVLINTTNEECVCCVLYLFLRCYEISYLRLGVRLHNNRRHLYNTLGNGPSISGIPDGGPKRKRSATRFFFSSILSTILCQIGKPTQVPQSRSDEIYLRMMFYHHTHVYIGYRLVTTPVDCVWLLLVLLTYVSLIIF